MSTSAIGGFATSYLEQVVASVLQNTGVTSSTASTSGAGSAAQSDSSRLSPFAQLVSSLQQLQQSNPTEYKQVTAEIATDLQTGAQTAQSQGNSAAANQLSQLATDFSSASKSGQLPNLQDLAQAIGGGGRHHHHHSESSSDSSSTAASSTSSTSSSSQTLSQLLALFQTSDAQSSQGSGNSSLDPSAIILQTLSNAGINVSNN
jgi:hypothetical protein